MIAYYNENDPAAAAWLRWLIGQGLIADGYVDERSIADVEPQDLAGYAQVHFFAGIGGWSLACRLAGWPDDRPIWSASCPCQPFSVAGKGAGIDDPRHLWPHVLRLASSCRPAVIVGEQVAGTAGYGWFDGVRADLEGEGYASRAVDIPACAVDAPHIRQRLYWCAVAKDERAAAGDYSGQSAKCRRQTMDARPESLRCDDRPAVSGGLDAGNAGSGNLGDAIGPRLERQCRDGDKGRGSFEAGPVAEADVRELGPERIGFADNRKLITRCEYFSVSCGRNECNAGCKKTERRTQYEWDCSIDLADCDAMRRLQSQGRQRNERRWAANSDGSFWSGAEWLTCHDGKARRTEPGISLLAHGVPGRVAAWRGFGNAIVPPLAAEVIGALSDTLDATATTLPGASDACPAGADGA